MEHPSDAIAVDALVEHPAPHSEVVLEIEEPKLEEASPDSNAATTAPEHQPKEASPEKRDNADANAKTTAAIGKRPAKVTKQKLAQIIILHKFALSKDMLGNLLRRSNITEALRWYDDIVKRSPVQMQEYMRRHRARKLKLATLQLKFQHISLHQSI